MQDVVEHFSARTLSSSSPPTLFGPLTAPSCQSLSGQLTGSCRAFPATRAAGKRPSVALFDVPSPLIHFTWTALCAHFLLNRSSTQALVLWFLCNYSSFYVSVSLQHRAVQSQILLKLSDGEFRGLFLFIFLFISFFLFLHIKHTQCRQLFGCLHGGQKFCRCVAQMPYFPSVARLELWFVGSLACRATSSSFLENCTKSTQWSAGQEQDVTRWSGKGL